MHLLVVFCYKGVERLCMETFEATLAQILDSESILTPCKHKLMNSLRERSKTMLLCGERVRE